MLPHDHWRGFVHACADMVKQYEPKPQICKPTLLAVSEVDSAATFALAIRTTLSFFFEQR